MMENELGKDRVLEGAIRGTVGNDLGGVRLRNALGSGWDGSVQTSGGVPSGDPELRGLVLGAGKAVGSRLIDMVLGPPARVGEALVTGKDVSLEDVTGANMLGMGAGWKGGLPAGATGVGMSFKTTYPTFEIYAAKMKELGIPLDILQKQRAKGVSYHSIPATKEEYLARAGEVGSFERSVVKDTVYHGTTKKFDVFNPLSHFGTEKAANKRLEFKGEKGSTIIPVKLDIRNPISIRDTGGEFSVETVSFNLEKEGIISKAEKNSVYDAFESNPKSGENVLVNILSKKGYDGFEYINRYEDPGSKSWIPFRSEQVIRDKVGGQSVDLIHLKDDAMAIAKEYDIPLKSVEQKITRGSSTTGGLAYLKEGKIKVTFDYGTEPAYMELAHELAHFVEKGHNKKFESIHKEIYEKLVARNKGADWTKDASFEFKFLDRVGGKP